MSSRLGACESGFTMASPIWNLSGYLRAVNTPTDGERVTIVRRARRESHRGIWSPAARNLALHLHRMESQLESRASKTCFCKTASKTQRYVCCCATGITGEALDATPPQ